MSVNGYRTMLPPLDQQPPSFARMDVSASVPVERPCPYSCRVCNFETADIAAWEAHVLDQLHRSALSKRPDHPEIFGRTLFVTGTPINTTSSRVFRFFSDFGNVCNVVAIREGDPSGYFFVEFVHKVDAESAVRSRPCMDGIPLRASWRRVTNSIGSHESENQNEDGGELGRRILAAVKITSNPMEQAQTVFRQVAESEDEKQGLRNLVARLQQWLETFFPQTNYAFQFLRGSQSGFSLKNSPVEIYVDCPGVPWEAKLVVIKSALEAIPSCNSVVKIEDPKKPGVVVKHVRPQGLGGEVDIAIWTSGMKKAAAETNVLRFYSGLDLRLKLTVVCLMWWARREGLTTPRIYPPDPSKLDEVSFMWLVLTGLIHRLPASNNNIPSNGESERLVLPTPGDYFSYPYSSAVTIHVGVEELFLKFFKFVANTDFGSVRVATAHGKLLSRGAKETQDAMILEHPMDMCINMASGYSHAGLARMKAKVANCLEVFAVFDSHWDVQRTPKLGGEPIPRKFLTKNFPLLYLSLGYPVATGMILQRGVPKKILNANRTYKSSVVLRMEEICPAEADTNEDPRVSETKQADWCRSVVDIVYRVLGDVLRFQVRDVTDLGRPVAGNGETQLQMDYRTLLSSLGVTFSEEMVAKELQEAKNDEVLGVFYVQAFWPTWERRKRVRERLLEAGGASAVPSFFQLEKTISVEVIEEWKKDKPGQRRPSQDLPRTSFLADIRRKKDPTRVMIVFTDIASRHLTLKSLCNFLKRLLPQAVAASSSGAQLETDAVREEEAEVANGDGEDISDENGHLQEVEARQPSPEPKYNRYRTLTVLTSNEDEDDDELYDPAKVPIKDVIKIDDEAYEEEILARNNNHQVNNVEVPLSALFADECSTSGSSIDGDVELNENRGQVVESDAQFEDKPLENPLAAVLAYTSPSPTISLVDDVEMIERDLEEVEEFEEIDVYDADKQENPPLSPSAVRMLFDGDSDGEEGYHYVTFVKFPHIYSQAPKIGLKRQERAAEEERLRQTYMQDALAAQSRPVFYGYPPAMPPGQRKVLKLKGWNDEESVNRQLESQRKAQLVAAGEKRRKDSDSSSSPVPPLLTSPTPPESKKPKFDFSSVGAVQNQVAATNAEGTFLGGFFQKRAAENGFPFLKEKPAELPLLTSPAKNVLNGFQKVGIEVNLVVGEPKEADLEIVEEISPGRRLSGDTGVIAGGDGPGVKRRTPPTVERNLPFL